MNDQWLPNKTKHIALVPILFGFFILFTVGILPNINVHKEYNSADLDTKAILQLEEKCEDFLANKEIKICEDVNGPKDDYWGSKTITQVVKVNTVTNQKDVLLTKNGHDLSYTAQAGDNVYFSNFPYEGSGNGSLYMINLAQLSTSTLDLNVYGVISPNSKYYVTNGDTKSKDGLSYCTNPMNGFQAPGSAIKLLNLTTGEITTIAEDKNMIYDVNKWSDDSSEVIYTRSEVQGLNSDLCPNLVNTYSDNRVTINSTLSAIKTYKNDTKKYLNEGYGFEFDYPASWVVDEGKSDDPTIAAFHPSGSVEGVGVKLYYVKSFANFGTVKSLPELLQAVKGTYNAQPNLTFTSTTTGGFSAVIVSGLPGYVDNEEEAYILLDNGVLRIYPGSYIGSVRKISKP